MKPRSHRAVAALVALAAIITSWACTAPSTPGAGAEATAAANASTEAPQGAWLGEPTPGTDPTLFAPGVVSTDLYERDLAFSPAADELYWTVVAPARRYSTVVSVRRRDDGTWTEPAIPPLFRGHNSLEPFVSADGTWLWFASTRPLPGEKEPGDWNLWRARRDSDGWGVAEPLLAPVNSDGDEFYPSLTRDGTVYFTAEREGGLGGEDLYRSRPAGDGWSPVENLGPAVNSGAPEFNAQVHPDGDWLLFGSVRAGDQGGGDLYISFADGAGGWHPAVALPPPLNSPVLDFCPALSPDGQILFFSSTRSLTDPSAASSYDALEALLHQPGNGQGDVYWVDAGVLDALRPADG